MDATRNTGDLRRRNLLRMATAGVAGAAVGGTALAAPAAANPPFVPLGSLVVDVSDHGAVGDGTGDDTAAIQAALTAGKGGIVFLPPGTYPVSTMLTVYSGTTVLATATTVVRRIAGPCLMGNGELGDFTATGYDGESNIVIRGGVWDVNAGQVAASGAGFGLSHGENVSLYDLRVLDVQRHHAIEVNGMKNVRIVNCRFEGFSDPDGNRGYSEAVQMDYAGGPSHFGLFGAPDYTGCQDIEFTGCYCGPSDQFPSYPRMVGSHGGPNGHQHTGLRITSSYAEGCTEWAIRLYDWLDALVEGNQVVGGGGGIQIGPAGVQSGGNIIVRGNTVRRLAGVSEAAGRPPDAAICVGRLNESRTRHLVLDGNVVEDVRMEGIAVYRTDGAVVANNIVTGCDGVGIRVNRSPRALVRGNNVATPGREGVVVHVGSDYTRVSDNILKDSATYGVSVTDAVTDVVVRDNTVLGAGRTTGTVASLRVSNNANRTALVGNTVRRRGSGNEAAYGISITSTCAGTWYTGNDLRDAGPSGAANDAGTGSSTNPGGPT
ncbi:right-handed parallel beta-helix repeat-containing protein [Polymorphospora rubra]|uniref:right-handed parallel beta-helix repeat-containing protein n=1 Tax=Polymorphospora rubra TaxID=338584 RepID=UPI0033F68B85